MRTCNTNIRKFTSTTVPVRATQAALTLRYRALNARIKHIARKQGNEFRLIPVLLSIAVLFEHAHETGDATDRLGAGGVDVVDVVVVEDPEVGRSAVLGTTTSERNSRVGGRSSSLPHGCEAGSWVVVAGLEVYWK
jgi:hypothetical protein